MASGDDRNLSTFLFWVAITAVGGLIVLVVAGIVHLDSLGHSTENGAGVISQTTTTQAAITNPSSTINESTIPTSSTDLETTTTEAIQSTLPSGPIPLMSADNDSPYVVNDAMNYTGSLSINGEAFAIGASGNGAPDYSPPNEIDFNLSRNFKVFKARIGVADESLSFCTAEIEVVLDGNMVIDHTFAVGQSMDLALNVTGVLRVQVIIPNSSAIPGLDITYEAGACQGGIGNPTASS